MKGDAKVIEYLNAVLKGELTAVNQYWLHYRLLDNLGIKKLAEYERHESIDEMKHADKLMERIFFLDGFPGMNDGIWDLADVSIEGVFTPENDELLLTEYLGSKPDQNEYKHFLANKIYVDYLWTLWAKTRVPYDGQPMEDWAVERYARLKDNLRLFAEA